MTSNRNSVISMNVPGSIGMQDSSVMSDLSLNELIMTYAESSSSSSNFLSSDSDSLNCSQMENKLKNLSILKKFHNAVGKSKRPRARQEVSKTASDDSVTEDRQPNQMNISLPTSLKIAPTKEIQPLMLGRHRLDRVKHPRVLVHGSYIRDSPIQTKSEANFSEGVHGALNKMKIDLFRIQAYSWPVIMRSCHAVMINPPKSGKTMAYLPAICSHLMSRDIQKVLLPDSFGPIGVILVPSSSIVDTVKSICLKLLAGSDVTILKAHAWDGTRVISYLCNGCDLLITTPQLFVWLLQHQPFFNLDRLMHLVLDGVLDDKFDDELQTIRAMCVELDQKRNHFHLQKIIASDFWNSKVKAMVQFIKPVLIIGAHLESAIYANVKIAGRFVDSHRKPRILLDILEPIHSDSKIVVVLGNAKELESITPVLDSKSMTYLVAHENMGGESVENIYSAWNLSSNYGKCLLLCTDELLMDLDITDANVLVHYSLPETWSTFTNRFSCLIDSYDDKLSPEDLQTPSAKMQCYSHMLFDEDNSKQLPRIVSFMERLGNEVDPKLYALAKKVEQETETKRAIQGVLLCEGVQGLGFCARPTICNNRHKITSQDKPLSVIPTSGEVQIDIVKIHTVAHYSVKLLNHRPSSNCSWEPPERDCMCVNMELEAYFTPTKIKRAHGAPSIGDVCAMETNNDVIVRCQVLAILSLTPSREPKMVKIRLIDSGEYLNTSAGNLIALPKHLKNLAPEVIDVRLCNIKPHQELEWGKEAGHILQKMLNNFSNDTEAYVFGNVRLALGSTLWLDSVSIRKDLNRGYGTLLSITQKLINANIAERNGNHIPQIYALCREAGIDTPASSLDEQMQQKEDNIHTGFNGKTDDATYITNQTDRWVQVDHDIYHRVIFTNAASPTQFYVRLADSDSRLDHLNDRIQEHMEDISESHNGLKVGSLCLAKSPLDHIYQRGMIVTLESINSNTEQHTDEELSGKTHVFFIDYGDRCLVDSADVYPISNELIEALPFQAIECGLYGVSFQSSESDIEACDILYEKLDNHDALYIKVEYRESNRKAGPNKHWVTLTEVKATEDIIYNEYFLQTGLAVSNDLDCEATPSDTDKINNNENTDIVPCTSNKEQTLQSYNMFDDSMEDTDIVNPDLLISTLLNIPLATVRALRENSETSEKKKTNNKVEGDAHAVNKVVEVRSKHPKKPSGHLNRIPQDMPPLIPIIFTPTVIWRQDHSFVTFKVQLVDVLKYDILLQIRFLHFSTLLHGKLYQFQIKLFGGIVPSQSYHETKGQYMLIKCKKLLKGSWWPRVTLSSRKVYSLKREIYADASLSDEQTETGSRNMTNRFAHIGASNSDHELESSGCSEVSDLEADIFDPLSDMF